MSLGDYTVDHVILCKKLLAMGFGSVKWFQSYLNNRQQIVNVNKVESKPLWLTCGVPQGTLLGPLLFVCYINDMPISVNCKLLLHCKKLGVKIYTTGVHIVQLARYEHHGRIKLTPLVSF